MSSTTTLPLQHCVALEVFFVFTRVFQKQANTTSGPVLFASQGRPRDLFDVLESLATVEDLYAEIFEIDFDAPEFVHQFIPLCVATRFEAQDSMKIWPFVKERKKMQQRLRFQALAGATDPENLPLQDAHLSYKTVLAQI